MRHLVFLIFTTVFLSGCAQTVSKSNPVHPAYAHFYALTCNQLMEKAETLSSKAKLVSSYWAPSHGNIAITTNGRHIDWPRLEERAGNRAISTPLKRRLTSEMVALETVAKQKHCLFNLKPMRVEQPVVTRKFSTARTKPKKLPPFSYRSSTIGHDPNPKRW